MIYEDENFTVSKVEDAEIKIRVPSRILDASINNLPLDETMIIRLRERGFRVIEDLVDDINSGKFDNGEGHYRGLGITKQRAIKTAVLDYIICHMTDKELMRWLNE